MSPREQDRPNLWLMMSADGTPRAALIVAIVVGTILTVINQGDIIWEGRMPNPLKVGLTYLVPYCVATYGAVMAKRAAWRARRRTGKLEPRD